MEFLTGKGKQSLEARTRVSNVIVDVGKFAATACSAVALASTSHALFV